MKLQNCFTLLLASYGLAHPTSKSIRSGDCLWTGTGKLSQEEIVQHWYTLWAGDYSYLNKTVTPNVQLYQDRFPTGNGSASLPVFDSSAMLSFVKTARTGFETYSFIDDFHYGVENLITLRWTLNATSAGGEDSALAAGTPVAYNGTDILIQEPCSGLVQEILSAQDLITLYHVLKQPIGNV